MVRAIGLIASLYCATALRGNNQPAALESTREKVVTSQVFQEKVQQSCARAPADQQQVCQSTATGLLFCQLIQRSKPELSAEANCTQRPSEHVQPSAPSFAQLFMERA